jgi:hypothetical protein
MSLERVLEGLQHQQREERQRRVDQMPYYVASVVVSSVVVAVQHKDRPTKRSHEHNHAVAEQVLHKLGHLDFVVDMIG